MTRLDLESQFRSAAAALEMAKRGVTEAQRAKYSADETLRVAKERYDAAAEKLAIDAIKPASNDEGT